MVERICPQCQQGNPLDNQFCGRCGSSLARHLPALRNEHALSVAGRQLPVSLRQVSQGLAISLAALAVEAGFAWLRGRIERGNVSAAPARMMQSSPSRAIQPAQSEAVDDVTTVISQRVLEIWEHGELTRKIVERSAWRRQSS